MSRGGAASQPHSAAAVLFLLSFVSLPAGIRSLGIPSGATRAASRSLKLNMAVQTQPREKTWSNPTGQTLRPLHDRPGNRIWLAERPFVWNTIDVGGRCAIVQLPSGGLWVHSPVALDDDLLAELRELGPVKYVVSPNYEHVKYAAPWIEAFPDAVSYVCPDGKAKFPGIPFDEEIPANPQQAQALFEGAFEVSFLDFEVNPFTGKPFFNECIFCHKETKSLIVTDFWWNWPGVDDYPGLATTVRLWRFGMDQVFLPFYKAFMVKDAPRLRQRMQQILSWDFNTIVPCHGFIIDKDVKQRFQSFYPE
mmetsp:Transcript_2104/g.9221  ORF Transcript_2104/g.9221 Transcript_2104/m.9221 type:complete len:307 (-) Transcript_2104:92-1012(-)